MPLKKLEGRILIEATKVGLLPEEKKEFSKGTMRLLLNVVTFLMIFLFDRLIYETLSIVARHSYIEYTQKGEYSAPAFRCIVLGWPVWSFKHRNRKTDTALFIRLCTVLAAVLEGGENYNEKVVRMLKDVLNIGHNRKLLGRVPGAMHTAHVSTIIYLVDKINK